MAFVVVSEGVPVVGEGGERIDAGESDCSSFVSELFSTGGVAVAEVSFSARRVFSLVCGDFVLVLLFDECVGLVECSLSVVGEDGAGYGDGRCGDEPDAAAESAEVGGEYSDSGWCGDFGEYVGDAGGDSEGSEPVSHKPFPRDSTSGTGYWCGCRLWVL